MQALIARLAVEPLAADRPLWQFHLVRDFLGKQALLVRVHHCIADGIALVGVMLSLTDRDAGSGSRQATPKRSGHAEGRLESNPWRPYLEKIVAHPDAIADYAQFGSHVIKDALRIVLMPDDTATALKGIPGNIKAVAWNEPMPLDEIKAVSKVLGVSINDVLLSCVAGALRRYLAEEGAAVVADIASDCEVRAMVPVNLRPVDQALELGNRFGLVPLCLPVGIANPIARLREIRRRTAELKEGYQAMLAFGALGVLGLVPRSVQKLVLDVLSSKTTAVMTNVPGPREPVFLAGSKVSRIMFWVPQSGNIGVGVSILSYAGSVQFGLITDTQLCAQPQRIVDAFAPEFEKLILLLSLLPAEMFLDTSVDPVVFEQALFGHGVPA